MGFDAEDAKYTSGVNVPLAWAMFGGSTFILFLLCYFCQKKMQDEDIPVRPHVSPRQIYVIPTSNHQRQVPNAAFPPLPSPPPEYSSVGKKEPPVFAFECDPPSYETAINCDQQYAVDENGEPVKPNTPSCCSTVPLAS